MVRGTAIVLGLSLLFLAVSAKVHAQSALPASPTLLPSTSGPPSVVNPSHTAPSPDQPERVVYVIQMLTTGQRFDVRTEADQVIARCVGRCVLRLPLGSYSLGLYDADGFLKDQIAFNVTGPGKVEVKETDPDLAAAGLVMGSLGPALVVVGLLLAAQNMCIEACEHGNSNLFLLGAGMMLTGSALTPVGWVVYARNKRLHAIETSLVLPYATPTSDRRGGVIGVQGVF